MTKELLDVGYSAIRFVEVECRAAQKACAQHEAGRRGWPTFKSFSAVTGPAGAHYTQKDSGMVCDDLKQVARMRALIEETAAAGASSAEEL